MCKVSIIIPVFNTGEYLRRCIDSVVNQTLEDIEIILVNDGSTDESGIICDEYAEKDIRIKVFHKDNEGVSIARNLGLDMARGEFIGFVDSDDWIEENMYSDLYSKAQEMNTEIVMCDTVTKYENKKDAEDTITQLEVSGFIEKIPPNLLIEVAGSACRCIYKNSFLKEKRIRFPENLKISEDRIFNIFALGYSKKFYYIKKGYYNRFVRKGSAVNSYHKDAIEIAIDGRKRTMEAIDIAWDGDETYKTVYENHIVIAAYSAINGIFSKDCPLKLKEKYIEVRYICAKKEVRDAIRKLKLNDIRAKLILQSRIAVLCLIAKTLNKRHGR